MTTLLDTAPPPATGFEFTHEPVLLSAILEGLPVQPHQTVVDVTVGLGGHAQALARQLGPEGLLIAMDRDPVALAQARHRLEQDPSVTCRMVWVNRPFSQLELALEEAGIPAINGVLLADLGVSSYQLDDARRGFSFSQDGPLDMRMNPDATYAISASEWLAQATEAELADCLHHYGEERLARPIARAIMQRLAEQPITSTSQLANLVAAVYRRKGNREQRIHPATRVFQAIRIQVNDELGQLSQLLAALPSALLPGSRAGLISFHSLEDRAVKQAIRRSSDPCTCAAWVPICQCGQVATLKPLGNKPYIASEAEALANPRARSAKLRLVERI